MSRFDEGYANAVACIVKGHGESTETREALEANGMTSVETLQIRGVDPYDIEILKPLVREIERKEALKAPKGENKDE